MDLPDRIPYPGLRAYETSESDLFFGREDCVDAMLERLAETRFLAVLGNSGSGKSSLVRTGLLDALELGFLATAPNKWRVADMHPGGRPLLNLAKALARQQDPNADEIDIGLLQGQLSGGPRSLIQWCDEGNLREDEALLLLVDQFEELFGIKTMQAAKKRKPSLRCYRKVPPHIRRSMSFLPCGLSIWGPAHLCGDWPKR